MPNPVEPGLTDCGDGPDKLFGPLSHELISKLLASYSQEKQGKKLLNAGNGMLPLMFLDLLSHILQITPFET